MLLWTVVVSMTDWVGMNPTWKFAGFKNYKLLFSMPRFWVNMKNNIIWLVVFVVPTGVFGMILAYLLELFPSISRIVRPIYLYPLVVAPIVAGTLWAWFFDPQSGVLNSILDLVNLSNFKAGWIADPKLAVYCMIVAGIWQNLGFALVLYTAAIREIPREHIEAAKVDGANMRQIFFHIVVPEIGHATLIIFSLLVLYTLKVFDLVWIMTRGGPGYATEVLPYLMYRITFRQLLVGMGAAVAVVILMLSIVILIPLSKWMMARWIEE
ncbi:hypothetical protein AS005_01785 [Thermotoga sp. KOL6]|nr:hypothetical protein AS005_01785 [Thermotoga sp. KOL6]